MVQPFPVEQMELFNKRFKNDKEEKQPQSGEDYYAENIKNVMETVRNGGPLLVKDPKILEGVQFHLILDRLR